MKRRNILRWGFWSLAVTCGIFRRATAVDISARPVKKTDRCPVCGMFVYKYKKWVAEIILRDGQYFTYDGVKDLLKHYYAMSKYTPGRTVDDIVAIYVTDYYQTKLVDATTAFYVIGSDVLGPMGHELIPFADEAAAREFLADHRGQKILRYGELNPELPLQLDRRY